MSNFNFILLIIDFLLMGVLVGYVIGFKKNLDQKLELKNLVEEIYRWTNNKNTPWAVRAKKALDDKI